MEGNYFVIGSIIVGILSLIAIIYVVTRPQIKKDDKGNVD
jgi:hypothetical protein